MVIHDTGQVIEGKTIRLEDDSVIDVAILKSDISVNLVMHNSLALQRHGNAHHVLEASRLVRRTLLFSQVTAMPVVSRRQLRLSPTIHRWLLLSRILNSMYKCRIPLVLSTNEYDTL